MFLKNPDIYDIIDRIFLTKKCILKLDNRYYVSVKFHDRDNIYIGNSRESDIIDINGLEKYLTNKKWEII